jgi:hypothetical protein
MDRKMNIYCKRPTHCLLSYYLAPLLLSRQLAYRHALPAAQRQERLRKRSLAAMRVSLKGDTFFIVQYLSKEASKGGGGGE